MRESCARWWIFRFCLHLNTGSRRNSIRQRHRKRNWSYIRVSVLCRVVQWEDSKCTKGSGYCSAQRQRLTFCVLTCCCWAEGTHGWCQTVGLSLIPLDVWSGPFYPGWSGTEALAAEAGMSRSLSCLHSDWPHLYLWKACCRGGEPAQ